MDDIPKGRLETEALLQMLDELNSIPLENLTPQQRTEIIRRKRATWALARVSPEKAFEIVWNEAKKRGLR